MTSVFGLFLKNTPAGHFLCNIEKKLYERDFFLTWYLFSDGLKENSIRVGLFLSISSKRSYECVSLHLLLFIRVYSIIIVPWWKCWVDDNFVGLWGDSLICMDVQKDMGSEHTESTPMLFSWSNTACDVLHLCLFCRYYWFQRNAAKTLKL